MKTYGKKIYISQKSLGYTNAQWICRSEDEENMHNGNFILRKTLD